ncbi:MAG: ABC transporter permease [Limnochordaceae bacterium]|nr:ABC transporter permease [Limnochordaceae bacterium]
MARSTPESKGLGKEVVARLGAINTRATRTSSTRFNRDLVLGATLLALLLGLVASAGILAPVSPTHVDPFNALLGPSPGHWLGTDDLGRDLFSRVLYGGRTALWAGVVATGLACLVGVPIGLLAGYYPGIVGEVLMRLMDMLLAFPAILLAITLAAALGPGTTQAMIAIGVAGIPSFARLARAQTLAVKPLDFIEAARGLGASPWHILRRHVLPNIGGPIVVQLTSTFAAAVLSEAALSYLGLGTQPPTPSWGLMLQEAKNYALISPWGAIFPGLAIAWAVLGANLVGDGLRQYLHKESR